MFLLYCQSLHYLHEGKTIMNTLISNNENLVEISQSRKYITQNKQLDMAFSCLYYHNKQSPSTTILFGGLLSIKTRDIIANILGYMNIILLCPVWSKFSLPFGVIYCVSISYISIVHYIALQRRKSQKDESHNLRRDRVDVMRSYFI